MMRYLIVGGTSIFGVGIIDQLIVEPETEIIIATNLPNEVIFERRKMEWRELDLRNVEETNRIIKEAQADVIFDLATQDSVGYSWSNPTETVDVNVIGTINLLNAVRDYSAKSRVVMGGSGEEYGNLTFSNLPAKENANPIPNNIYGATKVCQTMFAKLYYQAYGLDIIVLRTFYETSTQQDDRFAISNFCKQFAEIEKGKRAPVVYTGNLNIIRDFTDVDDLTRAFIIIAKNGKSGEVYNAARGQGTTLLDVVRILERLTNIKVKIRVDSKRVRPMDSAAVVADIDKIKKDTGWEPVISREVTIKKILNYWRKKYSSEQLC